LGLGKQIRDLKRSFLQISGLPLAAVLSAQWLQSVADSVRVRSDTIYTPLVTLRIFLQQVLSDDASCKAAVARFVLERVSEGHDEISANSGPYCAARQRLSLQWLFCGVKESGARIARAYQAGRWFGFNVVLADGTTALMPDSEDNQERYPQQSVQKPGLGFPIVRIGALISLATGAVLDYALAPYEGKGSGETSLLKRMWHTLTPGDLLLADRYYATYAILALALRDDVAALMQNHAQRRVDYRKGRKLGERDHWVEWSKPKKKPVWMSEQEYSELPDKITVREFCFNGIDFVTTLTDAKRYRKKALGELYVQRWQIEVDFRSIKTHMGMEMLHCKTPDMVEREIAVNLLAYNLIRNAMTQAAHEHAKKPREISFRGAVQLILANAASIIGVANRLLQRRVDVVISAMASNLVGNREQSPQPRALKRRPKAYPLLTKHRREAVLDL
jgi:hypothetical protein